MRITQPQKEITEALATLPTWNLEELTIRNPGQGKEPDIPFHGFMRIALWDATTPVYQLSLRSLTLEGFSLRLYHESNHERGDILSVLYHLLRRLPLLECLSISPDHAKIRTPSPLSIDEIHLKAIDLSHQHEVGSNQWEHFLRTCAPRLESLVCRNIRGTKGLEPSVLMALVPPTPAIIQKIGGTHPSQNWVGHQELNISANRSWGKVVHMFLKYVPTLRILRSWRSSRWDRVDWVRLGLQGHRDSGHRHQGADTSSAQDH
ncbi:hypothetical protein BGX29_008557 [Mortierella sp. GBA35]|nr:hypothetical protein BGX29_008557 [Mortierella sp. GBA35]